MEREKISVIIPTYGRAASLQTAVNSVLAQTYTNIEIIVVDDNSASSYERKSVQEIMKKYTQSNMVYIQHETNRGGCAARNTGIKCATGKYIAFLDDDDRYMKTYVEKMYSRIKETSTQMVYMPNAFCDNGQEVYAYRNHSECLPEGKIFNEIISGKCPICIFFMAERDIVNKVGMFDEKLKGFQDCDIWFKLGRIGNISAIKESLAIYTRDGGDRITANPYKRERDLKVLKEKWIGQLNKEEQILFSVFVRKHSEQIALNKYLFNRCNHQIKVSNFEEYNNIMKTKIPKSSKIQLFLVQLLGQTGNKFYQWIRMALGRRHFVFYKEK